MTIKNGRNRPASDRVRLARTLAEWIARLGCIAAAEAEYAAVQGIGTRLGLARHDTGDGLSEFGVVVLAGHLGFSDRLQGGIDNDNSEDGIAIVGSIEHEAGSGKSLSIDFGLQAALRVFAGGVRPTQLLCARRSQHQSCEIPIEQRQVFHRFVIEDRRHIGAIGLQLGDSAVTSTVSVDPPT